MKTNTIPTPTDSNCYRWQHAWKAIDDAVRLIDQPYLDRAWVVAQRIIEAQASTYRPEVTEAAALAMAWEDFEIACRGSGQPGVGGAIFHLWSRIPANHDKAFQKALTEGFKQAVATSDPSILRYPATARTSPIATLQKGFGRAETASLDDSRWQGSPTHFNSKFSGGNVAPELPEEKELDTVGRPVFQFSILDGGRKDDSPKPAIPTSTRKPRK
jgi:hypothetical protein